MCRINFNPYSLIFENLRCVMVISVRQAAMSGINPKYVCGVLIGYNNNMIRT